MLIKTGSKYLHQYYISLKHLGFTITLVVTLLTLTLAADVSYLNQEPDIVQWMSNNVENHKSHTMGGECDGG